MTITTSTGDRTDLLSSCARAASAAESRFRIDRPIAPARASRIIALDDGAAQVVAATAQLEWAHARFYVCEHADSDPTGLLMREVNGRPVTLADELAEVTVVAMVATTDEGAGFAYALGKASWERGIQTVGLVLTDRDSDGYTAQAAVAALRPHARILLPTASELDVLDILSALRV